MDAVYSLALLMALLTGGASAAGAVAALLVRRGANVPQHRLQQTGILLAVTSFIFGLASALVHLRFGHGPRTLEPMAVGRFFAFHRAYWVVVILSFGSLVGWILTRRGIMGNGDSA